LPPPALTPSELAEQSRLLSGALEELRQKHDAARALHLLDQADSRYPAGALGQESRLLRLEALIALGRGAEAVKLLEAVDPSDRALGSRARELEVVLGEQLAKEGELASAERAFTRALEDGVNGDARQRALFGRAACRAQTGRVEPAREDLRQYLREFPQGRFGSEARRALERSGSPAESVPEAP
jgi:tetratricopeptide (TPR) repeat protein